MRDPQRWREAPPEPRWRRRCGASPRVPGCVTEHPAYGRSPPGLDMGASERRGRHHGQVVDLRREFSNSGTSAKSLVERLLRRVGKGSKVAPEAPATVFEDARGPNVRVLRQAQRRR